MGQRAITAGYYHTKKAFLQIVKTPFFKAELYYFNYNPTVILLFFYGLFGRFVENVDLFEIEIKVNFIPS